MLKSLIACGKKWKSIDINCKKMKLKPQDIRVAVDAVTFGYENGKGISVLLIRRRHEPFVGDWALPGGFVHANESLEDAVSRELEEETGAKIDYLEQLYTFGGLARDPRCRVITVSYFALVNPKKIELFSEADNVEASWFSIDEVPYMHFDHNHMVEVAYKRLRAKVNYEPVGFELLNEKFPFSDLEKLYTCLLGRAIDRRNFKKKVMSFGLLEELDEKVQRGAGRPAVLYRFNREKYFELKKEGFLFEIK